MGAALLTLIASFFNFWSVSYKGLGLAAGFGGSYGVNGWSLWWWIPVLIALAVGVIYALQLFKVVPLQQIQPIYLVYGAAGSFVLMIFVMIHAFAYGGSYADAGGSYSSGPGFGTWFALVMTLALTYFTALAAQDAGAKLPFAVPGPKPKAA
jgi:hypothetical protein